MFVHHKLQAPAQPQNPFLQSLVDVADVQSATIIWAAYPMPCSNCLGSLVPPVVLVDEMLGTRRLGGFGNLCILARDHISRQRLFRVKGRRGTQAMEIGTTRFGRIFVSSDQLLCFPEGLPGLEVSQQWVLIADRKIKQMAWLQSITEPAVAIPVIQPRDLPPRQRVRVRRSDVAPLGIRDADDCWVFYVVTKDGSGLRASLNAPIVVNRRLRVGRQVIAKDDSTLQDFLSIAPQANRRAA